jgi:hypothetical protein
MSNIRKISDPDTIFCETKTTIVKGVIQKKKVWKNVKGQEYEKVNGKFQPIRLIAPVSTFEMENNNNVLFICCVLSIITMIFLFGVSVGSMRSYHKSKSMKEDKIVDHMA